MPSQDPNSIVLSLYRAILRAATYLPDSQARSHVYQFSRHRIENATEVTASRLKNARKAVRTLQFAADGDPQSLKYVLSHTYGITGPKRRELLNRLRALSDSQSKSNIIENHDSHASKKKIKLPKTLLQTFMASQIAHTPEDLLRKKLRRATPVIPTTNIWGRPMPKVRVKNITLKFWRDAFERLRPPIPSRDWNRLKDFATGNIELDPIPARRAKKALENDCFDLESFTLQPIRCHNRFDKRGPHDLTPRYRKRMYGLLWSNVATLETSSGVQGQLAVTWGAGRSPLEKKLYAEPRPEDLVLFEGLDPAAQVKSRKDKYS